MRLEAQAGRGGYSPSPRTEASSNALRRAARPSREGLIAALEGINEVFGGYRVNFGAGQHVASRYVELSMLTGDGRIRT